MAPADFRSALHRFAGSLLIGFAATGHRGTATRGHITPVPRRISPVPWPAIQPFRSPYPGGSIGAAHPSSSRRRSPSPIFAGLGSRTSPATQASLTRRQDSSSYGPVGCSPPKETLSWRFDGRVSPSAGHQLRGCLATTPTGLSPASPSQLDQDTHYGPLRLPLGRLPLPGITGYRQDCYPSPQNGAEEDLSSSEDNLPTIPSPLRREVPRHRLQDQRCRPWPSPLRNRLGSSLVRRTADRR